MAVGLVWEPRSSLSCTNHLIRWPSQRLWPQADVPEGRGTGLTGFLPLSPLWEPFLFLIGASQVAHSNPHFLGGALAFCAGTFLCISCADLLPELQFHSHDRLRLSLGLLAGLGVAWLIGQAESGHEHHHEQAHYSINNYLKL